jgi:hypothetical protein
MRLKGCDMLKLSLRPCFSARQAPYCRRLLPRNQRPATTGVITIPISYFLRTKDGREVDFAVAKDDSIEHLYETKYSDNNISKNLLFFSEKYNYPATQLVYDLKQERQLNAKVCVKRADDFLKSL